MKPCFNGNFSITLWSTPIFPLISTVQLITFLNILYHKMLKERWWVKPDFRLPFLLTIEATRVLDRSDIAFMSLRWWCEDKYSVDSVPSIDFCWLEPKITFTTCKWAATCNSRLQVSNNSWTTDLGPKYNLFFGHSTSSLQVHLSSSRAISSD